MIPPRNRFRTEKLLAINREEKKKKNYKPTTTNMTVDGRNQ